MKQAAIKNIHKNLASLLETGMSHMNGAAIIGEDGTEIPITEQMVQNALEMLELSAICPETPEK